MTSHLHRVLNQEVPRDYRTEIPNVVFELLSLGQISTDDFLVYCLFRKIAGQNGKCWIGMRGIKEMLHMHHNKIADAKNNLSLPFDLLNGKPLILIQEGDYKNGRADIITITDIWPENHYHFKEKYTCVQVDTPLCPGRHTPVSKQTQKKEPLRNNHKETVLCSSPPVAPSEPWEKFEFLDCEGKKFTLCRDDLTTACVMRKKDWTLIEIHEIWNILVKYTQPIRDWFLFCEGTIEKIRLKKSLNAMKETGEKCLHRQNSHQKKKIKENSKCKKEEISPVVNTNAKTLEKDTKMPLLATFALERGWTKN